MNLCRMKHVHIKLIYATVKFLDNSYLDDYFGICEIFRTSGKNDWISSRFVRPSTISGRPEYSGDTDYKPSPTRCFP